MARSFICDLSDGSTVDETYLVSDKMARTNRNGDMYLHCELSDRTGTIGARYWNATNADAVAFDVGDFLALKGKVQLFQGQLQLIIHSFRRCDPASIVLADFMPTTDKDIAALEGELRHTLLRITNPAMQAIAQAFLIDEEFMRRFAQAPAGIRNHHAYLGGLLEHVVAILRLIDRLIDLYPELDHDLLRMGAFLHDIGKIRELEFERGFAYSDEGQLVGHLVIGVEMLDEKLAAAAELLGDAIPNELTLRLKHLILSHHGTYEFGSPRLPMTAEAIALHHLDNLDAKIHNFSRAIADDPNRSSRWTPFDPALGRRLFKGSPTDSPAATPETLLR